MKAAVFNQYGRPQVLEVMDIEKPICKPHEILIKVMAAPVNSGDVRVRGLVVKGFMKIIMRLVLGLTKPRKPVLGSVFAGVVESTGSKVTKFTPGDRVFGSTGFQFGCHAEYICVRENSVVAKMPATVGYAEAAALPFGWQTAIHFLTRANIKDHKNAKVLVYGATGSVGVAALQLAKYYGATVTAAVSTRGIALAEALGADEIIVYDRQKLTNVQQKFDIVFDAVGKISNVERKLLLQKSGVFKTVGGLEIATERVEQLHLISKICNEGKCKPVIDKAYTLNEIVEAHRYVDTGRKKGNVVVIIGKEEM